MGKIGEDGKRFSFKLKVVRRDQRLQCRAVCDGFLGVDIVKEVEPSWLDHAVEGDPLPDEKPSLQTAKQMLDKYRYQVNEEDTSPTLQRKRSIATQQVVIPTPATAKQETVLLGSGGEESSQIAPENLNLCNHKCADKQK